MLYMSLAAGCATVDEPERQTGAARTAFSSHHHGTHEQRSDRLNPFPFDDGRGRRPSAPRSRPARRPLAERSALREGVTSSPATTRALVLYDQAGDWAWLGQFYAVAAGNLASHFGGWDPMPVSSYQAGDMNAYSAVIYVGSTYDEPLPSAFLDDVLLEKTPVVWLNHNIWQLSSRVADFPARYGFQPWTFETASVGEVLYKGSRLTRYTMNGAGIMTYSGEFGAQVSVLAQAVRSDGVTFPWALRSKNLTYIGEIPFSYISETDRYLVFCDLLFDALAPTTPERHRALVRIEDVDPAEEPQKLIAIANYLWSERVPFSIATIPMYVDAVGAYSGGVPETMRLRDENAVVKALKHMIARGGELVMHGYTHQYGARPNPYSGVSADDFEFWLSHVDADDYVIYDGPVPEDSASWALGRIEESYAELSAAGLPAPTIFEYPHYAGSAVDSRAIAQRFPTAYHRGLYFGGALGGGADDHSRMLGQFFPYLVRDTYGWQVIPENLGSYEPEPYNHHPARLPADLIASARANLVVRDGVASFYFHPFLELDALREIVQGIKAAGYTFVSPRDL
ncbi:hypothetical protein SCE1572_13145 [Sorangium cellulosum So0157-2]|uniref:DUF2334 domain-containing protein n=2 Tax=Sorangium cellulosum TaxID=56 RepID=S4XU19_SORCE|nr:hypothetical protein SCE1572_13145 [Sorangium cellulosum So0157-2]